MASCTIQKCDLVMMCVCAYCIFIRLYSSRATSLTERKRYEISVRSMNIDDRPTTDLRANSHILGKFQMTITLQRVNRSPSCLVLGWGFRGRTADRTAPFPVGSNSRWRPAILENFKWPYLSNALSDSLYVCTQTILCPWSLIYNDGDSKLIP